MIQSTSPGVSPKLYLVSTEAGWQYTWFTPLPLLASRGYSKRSIWRSLPERSIASLLRDLSILYESECSPEQLYDELVAGLELVSNELASFRRGLWALHERERRVVYHGKA